MKLSQLIVATGIVAGSLGGFGGIAAASPIASSSAVGCVNGDGVNDASVSTQIACDSSTCADGAPTTVTDENGVQHQACVDSATVAPAVPAPTTPAATPAARSSLNRTVPTTSPGQLPTTGAGTGGLIVAALLVASGSVASLLSRRRPDRQ